MTRVSALLRAPVVSEDGRSLGRIYDARVEWRDDRLVITSLVAARRGLWERLSGDRGADDEIPWSRVVAIGDRVVVNDRR